MSDATVDDRQFRQASTLRDGTPVTIRAMRADDRERLVAAFHKLDPGTVYTRFFSFVKEIPAASLAHVDEVDFDHFGALVVTTGSGDDEIVIGGASYIVDASITDGKAAEVAFTIEEDYQGQGLASQLLALLTTIARRHGVTRFEADVLSGNAPMLTVFQRCGLPTHRRSEGGVVHLTFDLTAPPA
ncbi:MAG TPA: GNAT family protein [Burkholderiaceae bacterium]|nr:GNAT family protein [Burkholderiaceae bacterium]